MQRSNPNRPDEEAVTAAIASAIARKKGAGMAEQDQGLGEITPEQFAQLVKDASDEDILAALRGVGTEQTLDRIFDGMQQRFQPDKAQGVDAVIQFVVTDEGAEHPYSVTIKDGKCEAGRGASEDPKVTLTTDLLSFAKLVGGQAQGPQLFMSGKLKISGDLMFSARIMSFFDAPTA
jgi:putative sterol carrier protein